MATAVAAVAAAGTAGVTYSHDAGGGEDTVLERRDRVSGFFPFLPIPDGAPCGSANLRSQRHQPRSSGQGQIRYSGYTSYVAQAERQAQDWSW